MSKIETFKNERLDIDLFAGAMIFIAFKRQFGESLNEYISKNSSDIEALAFIVLEAYKSACYIKNKAPELTIEDIGNKLDLNELLKCFSLLFPANEVEPEKKTKGQ